MNLKKVLLVEDNPDDQELISMVFEESHIANELVVLNDGAQVLDYLFGTGQYAQQDLLSLPQVILLDLKLPKVNGLEVLERLRANLRTALIPVVILTSSSEDEDILAGYQRGANSYVRKPVDFTHFVEAIKQLGLYWVILNHPLPES